MDGCDRVQGVRLRVFAFFNTRCNNDKKCSEPETEKLRKEHKIEASYSDVVAQTARVLNYLIVTLPFPSLPVL